jgi:SAM-dependent methyltransferase
MKRIPEPELMLDPDQAAAYAAADFEEPHSAFVERFRARFPGLELDGHVLDLGCGPGDIAFRFARAFPRCRVDGIDGAQAMLEAGAGLLKRYGVGDRVRLHACLLPEQAPPRAQYDALISNSLLHHLHAPQVLWQAVRAYAAPGAPIFVMDLMRPDSPQTARDFMQRYAGDEPEILQRDFYNSLLAAFTPAEVEAQLSEAGLSGLKVEVISDRHLVVWGYAPSG